MNSKLIIASVISALSLSVFAGEDIAGIKIGLPYASQKELLTKLNPLYKLDDLKLKTGQVIGVTAVAKNDTFIVIKNELGNVWFVGRSQRFDAGERINPDTLMSSLKEKYGPYTESSYGNATWATDRSGKLYQGALAQNPCVQHNASGLSINDTYPILGINILRGFVETCGTKIAMTSYKASDGMLSGFTVTIADEKAMYDETNMNKVSEEKKIKQNLTNEKSKDNKPKL